MFASPGAIAFSIGNRTVYWYGIVITVAFIAGLFTTLKFARIDYKDEETQNHLIDMSFFLLIGGIFFARMYYVIFDWKYYSHHLVEIFMTWKGGLSIHGAILGSVLIIFLYSRHYKLSVLKYTDLCAYGTILGQAIGRWGNFFNSEAFGKPTELPWKLFISLPNRPEGFEQYNFFHPTFLYESLWNLAAFLILITVIRKHFKEKTGAITCFYLILYSAGRFFIEGIRIDSIHNFFGLPVAQISSIVLFFTGLIGLFIIKHTKRE